MKRKVDKQVVYEYLATIPKGKEVTGIIIKDLVKVHNIFKLSIILIDIISIGTFSFLFFIYFSFHVFPFIYTNFFWSRRYGMSFLMRFLPE